VELAIWKFPRHLSLRILYEFLSSPLRAAWWNLSRPLPNKYARNVMQIAMAVLCAAVAFLWVWPLLSEKKLVGTAVFIGRGPSHHGVEESSA
jgi:hypothetical protein